MDEQAAKKGGWYGLRGCGEEGVRATRTTEETGGARREDEGDAGRKRGRCSRRIEDSRGEEIDT